MKRRQPETKRWHISELASQLPEELILAVEPQGDDSVSPSAARIKELALEKRNQSLNRNEETPMKKTATRMILIAAAVCLMSVTAFAALGGLDLIKGIFGESAGLIGNEIVTPQAAAAAQGREMAVEALVTDGFVTNLVVSLTGERPEEEQLFTVESGMDLRSNGWHVLEALSSRERTRYAVELISEQRFEAADVTLSLNPSVAPIRLSLRVENSLGNAVVRFPAGAMSGKTELLELQISQMGFLLIGHEQNARGGLPDTHIRLRLAGGKQEELDVQFDPNDETVRGGGGAVIDGGKNAPLVTEFYGARNPDGELVLNGRFSRVITPAEIEAVEIDGIAYPVG